MNRRDLGRLLAELHDDLKGQIEDLRGGVTEAKRLRASLKGYFEKCQAIIDQITDEDTGAEAYLQQIIHTKEAVDASKTTADQHLQTIAAALTSVQANITEMEEAYESFTEINEKLTDEETGLEAIKKQAEDLKTEIVVIKSDAGTLYKEIRKFRDNAAAYDTEFERIRGEADNTLESIRTNHEESNKLKAQITEIFKLGSKGALSNYFVERRNQLFWISLFWVVLALVLLYTTVQLAITYLLPIANELKNPNSQIGPEVFILRFALVTPPLFGALYAIKQYSNERRLYEKYAFKTIATYSIEASIGTLIRSISKHDHDGKSKQIIDFAINTFASIYDEPVEPSSEKWVFRSGNKLMDITAEIQQDMGAVKKDVDRLKKLKDDESS